MSDKMGAPTKYDPKYCQMMIDYFNRKPYKKVKEITRHKDGSEKETIRFIASDFPTFEGFATSIGVVKKTLLNWLKDNPDFLHAYNICKQYQKDILSQNGLKGLYNCLFAKFVAINATDMKEKQEIEHSGAITIMQQLSKLSDEEIEKKIKDLK